MNLNERVDFIISSNPQLNSIKPVVTKELIHYDILFHLRNSSLMPDEMTFIGGTCLRLCHGSARLSEDLDFHAGVNFRPSQFDRIRESLEGFLNDQYQLPVEVREPVQLVDDPEYANTHAKTWKVIIQTHPGQQDLPRQRIHIDIANLPTYEAEPDLIKVHYANLPDGYDSILVNRSSTNEILADKLIALAARPNIKARDLWDIQWLRQQGNVLDINLLKKKIIDHGIKDYPSLLTEKQGRLAEYWKSSLFDSEMARFLDSTRLSDTIQEPEFKVYLTRETGKIISTVLRSLEGNEPSFEL